MKLNVKALGNIDMNTLTKRDYKLVNGETIHHFSIVNLANGEKMVIVVTIENSDSYFYANGSLKNFLLDNIDIVEKNEKNQYMIYDYNVNVSCKGQIELNNGHMFTTWNIIIPD